MAIRKRVAAFDRRIRLQGDVAQHEQTDAWSNRDLIPLPPSRRTWGWFNFFGFWSIASLNLANWQTPNTYLSKHCYQKSEQVLSNFSQQWVSQYARPCSLSLSDEFLSLCFPL